MARDMHKGRFSSLIGGGRTSKVRRSRHKNHGHNLMVVSSVGNPDRRHGWGYVKRRATIEGY